MRLDYWSEADDLRIVRAPSLELGRPLPIGVDRDVIVVSCVTEGEVRCDVRRKRPPSTSDLRLPAGIRPF